MSALSELRRAVTSVVLRWALFDYEEAEELADAVLSVPALRDALARDAQVREIAARTLAGDPDDVVPRSYVYADGRDDVIALYPEVASMLRDGKG